MTGATVFHLDQIDHGSGSENIVSIQFYCVITKFYVCFFYFKLHDFILIC